MHRLLGLFTFSLIALGIGITHLEAAPSSEIIRTDLEWDLPAENWDCGIDVRVENHSISHVTADPRRGYRSLSYVSTTTYENVETGVVVVYRNIGEETDTLRSSPSLFYSRTTVTGMQMIVGPSGANIAAGRATYLFVVTYDDAGNVLDVWTEVISTPNSGSQPFDQLCDLLKNEDDDSFF